MESSKNQNFPQDQPPSTNPSTEPSPIAPQVIQPDQKPEVFSPGAQSPIYPELSPATQNIPTPPPMGYNDPPPKKGQLFNKIFWAAFVFFVVFPAVAALLAGTGGSWGTVGAIVSAITGALLLVTVWFLHKLWIRSKQKSQGAYVSAARVPTGFPAEDSIQNSKLNFLLKIGVVLFVITIFSLCAIIFFAKKATVASSYPAWYPVMEIFIAPVINLVGVGAAIWAISSLRQTGNRNKFILATALCLSPILLGLGFTNILKSNPAILNSPTEDAYTQKQKSNLDAISFTPYSTPASSDYSLRPHESVKAGTTDNIKLISLTLSYKKSEYDGQYISEFAADSSHSVTKSTEECYDFSRSSEPIYCSYAFTTLDGTVVLSYTDDQYGSTNTSYYFQKGQTYIYFGLIGASGEVTDPEGFINSLQPITKQSLENHL